MTIAANLSDPGLSTPTGPAADASLEDALLDVRNAYRLLWAYQGRVFDLIKAVVDGIGGLKFYHWDTIPAGRPGHGGSDPTRRPVWSMLPIASASFLYLPPNADPNAPRVRDWMLELRVCSDSGLPTHEDEDPDPRSFEPAVRARSELRAYVWRCMRGSQVNWYHGVWWNEAWPTADDVWTPAVLYPGFRVIRRSFPLAELADAQQIGEAILAIRSLVDASPPA